MQPNECRCEHVVPNDQSVCQYERVELDERPNVPSDDDVVPLNDAPNGGHSDGGVGSVQLHS